MTVFETIAFVVNLIPFLAFMGFGVIDNFGDDGEGYFVLKNITMFPIIAFRELYKHYNFVGSLILTILLLSVYPAAILTVVVLGSAKIIITLFNFLFKRKEKIE